LHCRFLIAKQFFVAFSVPRRPQQHDQQKSSALNPFSHLWARSPQRNPPGTGDPRWRSGGVAHREIGTLTSCKRRKCVHASRVQRSMLGHHRGHQNPCPKVHRSLLQLRGYFDEIGSKESMVNIMHELQFRAMSPQKRLAFLDILTNPHIREWTESVNAIARTRSLT
jgi:hypothetical protein